jgi:CheY-like chemotaxis protein
LEDSSDRNTSGIGLGLVISDKITNNFGGKISFKSEPGRGSTFTFTFKLQDEIETNSNNSDFREQLLNQNELVFNWKPSKEIPGHEVVYSVELDQNIVYPHDVVLQQKEALSRNFSDNTLPLYSLNSDEIPQKKILIVDDQQFNIEAMKIVLNYSVGIDAERLCDCAHNGKQALNMIIQDVEEQDNLSCSYNLILMDCNMPFMDGYAATTHIREYLYKRNITQPIITAVTGHSEQMYAKKCLESGMNQVASKPVDAELLTILIEKLGYVTWL